MKKRLFITTLLIFLIVSPLFAPDELMHNFDLEKILLGRLSIPNSEEKIKIELIEKAAYLCIDQFNHNKLSYLDDLRQSGVRNLPGGEEIDFVSGPEHQRYTHRGWDWIEYPRNIRGYNFQEKWGKRKIILLSTLDRVFGFKDNEIIKRDSLGAIIYYAHILGDHFGDNKFSYMDRMPISPRPDYKGNRSGPNSNNPTIYTELLYHLSRLFREQLTSNEYMMLFLFLEKNKNKEFPAGTTITDEEFTQLQGFARQTLDILCLHVPRLLMNESFFKRAFPQPNSQFPKPN